MSFNLGTLSSDASIAAGEATNQTHRICMRLPSTSWPYLTLPYLYVSVRQEVTTGHLTVSK